MSNASLIAALDAARADEVLERARNVIAKQDEIIAALREVQVKIAYDPGCGCPCCNINERLLAGRAAQALAEGV